MENTSDSETNLLKLCSWALLGVQIPGYFCHRTEKNFGRDNLSFKFLSRTSIYSLLILLLSVSWDIMFYARQAAFSKYLNSGGPTEVYAYNLVVAFSSALSIYYAFTGITKSKSFSKFWKENCNLLDEMKTVISSGQGYMEQKWFQDVEASGRMGFFTLIIPVALHIILVFGYTITDSILDQNGTSEDTQLQVGLAFWNFVTMSGSGISTWLLFFVQVYTACFTSIAETLKELGRPSSSSRINNKDSTKNDFGAKTNIYIQEIFSNSWIIPNQKDKRFKSVEIGKETLKSNVEEEVEKYLKVYYSVSRTVNSFNKFYGNIIMLETSICVLNLLVYWFFMLIWLGRGEFLLIAESLVPLYIFGKELYDLGSICEDLTQASDDVARMFSEVVPLESLSPHIHVKILVTQVASSPPVISAKQFFTMNRSLVTSILSALATFLVVLVQFKEAAEEEEDDILQVHNNNSIAV